MNEKNFHINMVKITAVLCALVALLSLVFFLAGKPDQTIKWLGEQIEAVQERITYQQEQISQWQADIAECDLVLEELNTSYTAASKKLEELRNTLAQEQASMEDLEDRLSDVCYRSYYSSYYCDSDCRSLHSAVDSQEKVVSAAYDDVSNQEYKIQGIQDNIDSVEYTIEGYKEDIASAESYIERLQEELAELKNQCATAWFVLLLKIAGILLVMAALGCFAYYFFTETENPWQLYVCGGLALASVLFMIADAIVTSRHLLAFLLHPHLWNIVVMACFASMIRNKESNPVTLRTFAVIAAVIVCLLGFVTGNLIMPFLYMVAMICVAFLLVPLEFTEYISIAKHIFLSVITLGVWQLVWFYHVTENLNAVPETDSRNPSWEMLMCMLLPLYYLYWQLKTAEITEFYGKANGKNFHLEVICIAFGIINPLFASVLIQNKINLIVGKPE